MKSLLTLLTCVVATMVLSAAETVAKFASLEAGATSGAYTIGENGRTITSDAAWLVANGVTIVFKYANLPQTGAERLVSWKQSNKTNEGIVGLCSNAGVLKGYWEDNPWTGGTINTSTLGTEGLIVCVYGPNLEGVTAYNAEGEEIFRAANLRATGAGATMGDRFDFSSSVTEVTIYNGATAADDVVAVATASSNDITLPNGTYTVSHVLSGAGAVIADAGANGVITLGAANTFTGGLTVRSGTLKTTSATGYGPNNWRNLANLATIAVAPGATLDLGNTKDTCYAITSAGTVTNSGSTIGSGSRQTTYLTLSGDTTVSGNQFGLIGPSYAATTLDLGEHTLTVNMASATTTFILCNCTVSGTGKIRLEKGKLYLKKAITGILNIDLPNVPDDGTTLFELDTKDGHDISGLTLKVTIDGEALPEGVTVSPEGVVTLSSPIVRDETARTWTLDTTDAAYTLTGREIAELKESAITFTVTSASERGATIDLGSNTTSQEARYVFASGSHTLKWAAGSLGNGKLDFDTAGTDAAPSVLVKRGATLNFYAKDVTGWKHDAKDAKTSVIKVESGATLKLYKNGNNTWYFQGRFIIEPGATVEAVDFEANKFRLNGGVYPYYQQLYVPAADGADNTTATYVSNVGFRLASDATAGYGIFVGEGSTLTLDGALTSDGARDLGKFGAGTLVITGSLTGMTGKIRLDGGALRVKATSGLADGTVVQADPDDMRKIVATPDGEWVVYTNELKAVFDSEADEIATEAVLRFSEIMPKPSDKPGEITTQAGYDKNGLESGWVELENTSDKWADLADYKFIRTNRSKANEKGDYGAFPSVMIPPHTKYVFYTSERYANSASKADSAFAEGTFDGKPMYFEQYGMMVWGDKINPKKFPFVRLYYKETTIVDTVVIPSDIPEGNSIIVVPVEEGQATVRYMTSKPTKGGANTALDDASIIRLGPNAGPLYEISTGKKHNSASEFARVAAPAVPTNDYEVVFSMNPTMSPTEVAKFREEDAIANIVMVVRTDLDDATRTNIVVRLETKTTDAKDWGDTYTATIPKTIFPAAGHLIQWKFEVTDAVGNTWTTPSFHNPDDGYEWYGTIVESEALTSKTLPTWHLFADAASKAQMDIDADNQDRSVVPHQARVSIYDSSTSNYYDYVRIDLRGNTSASFKKKSHGLRFAKAHPLTMWDPVTGETREEVRKSSLVGEPADPSRMRQMMAFWLWNKMGNKVPFDFPVRCNLNGEFFQLGFHSERFTDELIEDFHKLDKYGYGYKNVGTLASGSGTTAGGIEKKTPDDGNESDISVLQNELRKPLKDRGIDTLNASSHAELPEVTKFVVEKFNLPAWVNYLASARITQEMDDVWANISIYYDNAQMLEGVRGTGTWMPLGYDFNLTFGQWYINDVQGATKSGSYMVNQDWFKSHPFYGGNVVRCYKQSGMSTMCNEGNRGVEAVWQSPKFRRLYLRRLRTLMDQELGAPNADETLENTTVPVMVRMKEIADLMRADANEDTTKYPWDSSINNIDIWGQSLFPTTMDAGIAEIWTKYIVPRREHLYVTHSVTNSAKEIGYGSRLNAGIPLAQSPILSLRDKITAEYDAAAGAVVIRNANDETIDLSDWMLEGPVTMTLPAGTVIDAGTDAAPGEVTVALDRRAYVAALGEAITDQVIVGNATAGKSETITLTASDAKRTKVIFTPTAEYYNLRLHSFDGVPPVADGDSEEWIVLTNLSATSTLSLTDVRIRVLKDGDPEDAAKLDVMLTGGTLAPGASVKLEQTAFASVDWAKITNNKIHIAIWDANASQIQYAFVTQKNYANYYGDAGSKTAPIGGKFYLAATSFGETLAQADFTEVAYPSTTWEEVEVTDATALDELVPTSQAEVLKAFNVKPTTLAKWAKTHHAAVDTGTELDLEAFALDCAPGEVDEKKKAFKVTIAFDPETGKPVVTKVEGVALNVEPTIEGSTDLINWHDKEDGDAFFKAVIRLGE